MTMLSPKLRVFLTDHGRASQIFTNLISKAFTGRSVKIYYFYSDDYSIATCYHYYPDESNVVICVRENQKPVDEFISLVFEVINSESETNFQNLREKVIDGSITRTNFAIEVLKVEFRAIMETSGLLGEIGFTKTEIADSRYYKSYANSPTNFVDFIYYTEKMSMPERDPIKEYEQQYDLMRKH